MDIEGGYRVRICLPRAQSYGRDLDKELEQEELFDFSSGYIQRSISELPRNSTAMPWKLNQDYLFDKKILLNDPVDDGVIQFYGPNSQRAAGDNEPALEAAE